MKIKYYSHIDKAVIEVDVNVKTAHYLEKAKNERIGRQKIEKEYKTVSLDNLVEKGLQPMEEVDLDDIVIYREKERKYLGSNDYHQFRNQLKKEILNKFDVMPKYLRIVMFLRFFKDFSIGQIAKTLKISKSTAQGYIQRGCKYIKNFLDEDLKGQNEIDRLLEMQALEEFLEKYRKTI